MTSPDTAVKIRTMFATGHYTKKEIADIFQIHPDTVTNILKRTEERDIYVRTQNLNNLLITPYTKLITDWLSRGDMRSTVIHRRLTRMGAKLSLSTVTKAVKGIKYELDISAIRYETTPGRQAQADWGTFKGFSANINGIERPLYGFFLILGYSRMKYVEFTTDMTTETLIRCIENAFRYFGGFPEEILFDNMPQVVNRALIDKNTKDRALLPAFTSFSEYYGFNIRLARTRRPQEKGKVERFVGEFQSDFLPQLPKKTGHNLSELNAQAVNWCDEVNSRTHITTNKIPFEQLPDEGLAPLPDIRYLDNKTARVNNDGTLSYRGTIYNVDNKFSGCTGEIIDMENTIFIKIDGQLLILGRRDLPVYARHFYSNTKTDWRIQQHRKRKKREGILDKYISETFDKITVNRNTLTCIMKERIPT